MSEFDGVKVKKAWGSEHEVFNNGIISCWYLRINRDQQTSLHMHEHKRTALILLSGSAIVQEGFDRSRPITALDKTSFSERFLHMHTAINGDCELLEVENPINKGDLFRFDDAHGRAGQPYESSDSFEALTNDDPRFIAGRMAVGDSVLRIFEFMSAATFASWTQKLSGNSIVVLTRGALRSPEAKVTVATGDANWARNLKRYLSKSAPDDNMQAILISSTVTGGAI